jgi:hypothetical protein
MESILAVLGAIMGRHWFFCWPFFLSNILFQSPDKLCQKQIVCFEENRLHQSTVLPATAFTYACFCVSNPKIIEFKCQIQGSLFPSVLCLSWASLTTDTLMLGSHWCPSHMTPLFNNTSKYRCLCWVILSLKKERNLQIKGSVRVSYIRLGGSQNS